MFRDSLPVGRVAAWTGGFGQAARMTALRPTSPLVGERVTVEPIAEWHREELRAVADADPAIFRFMGFANGLGAEFDKWFDRALTVENEEPFVILVDGNPVGSSRFLALALEHRRAEIGWTWYARSTWGTGVNVETKLLLLTHAFETCGLMRVEFKTDALNERSRGALGALGAQFEGIFRKHMVYPDRIRDSAYFAIVDDDWPGVKAHLRKRLADLP